MSRVLCVRHHLEDSPGLIGDAFAERGHDVDLVMLDAESPTPRLTGYDLLVILGSKHAVYDEAVEVAWFGRELELLDEAEATGVAVLGICFGAQALCRHHGGVVTRADEPEIGWYEVDVVGDVDLPSGPWFEYHYDHCTLPAEAKVWATTPRAVQAFAIGANVGVQFHPEIEEVQLAGWFDAGDDEPRDFDLDAAALLAQTARETPAARQRAGGLVDLFLSHAASQRRSPNTHF
jgi:GMP synthase-like glutamine amidotransferase